MGIINKIAVLLGGQIKNDSRVRKICETLSTIAEVHLFYVHGSETDKLLFETKNIFLYNLEYPQTYIQKCLKHSFFYKEYDFYYNQIIQTGYVFDLIYANDLPLLNVGIQLKKKVNARLIYDSHEIYTETINQFFILRKGQLFKNIIFKFLIAFMRFVGTRFEKRALKSVDKFITVNSSIADYFQEKYRLTKKPYVVMNFPRYQDYSPSTIDYRKQYHWSADSLIFLYQGVLNYGRGLELLIDVFSALPERYKLVIIGDGILKNTLAEKIEKHNLSSNVKLIGFVQLDKLYNYTIAADVGINLLEANNLSKKMASPNKLFQYIQAEIPSINSKTIENIKIIEKNDIGWLVDNKLISLEKRIISITEYEILKKKEICRLAKKEYIWENQEAMIQKIIGG